MIAPRYLLIFILLLCIGVFIISLLSGAVWINPLSGELSNTEALILFDIRLPRMFNAFIVGAFLSVAGAAFQGLLQNPLADPYILGVSAGSGLGAAVAIVCGLTGLGIFGIPLFAFLGALGTVFLVYGLVRASGNMSIRQFILTGVIVNAFLSAVMMGILFFSGDRMSGVIHWLLGDLSTPSIQQYPLVIIGLPASLLMWAMSHQLNLAAMGDAVAQSMGVSIHQLRRRLFVLASITTGLAVSSAGIIGFVGLIVPHCIRLLSHDDFRWLIPLSFLLGGGFLMACDTIARTVILPSELPIGLLTSFLGGPFFIWVLLRAR